jgi:N-methylhydantoinase A
VNPRYWLGIDIGGTFTDFALFDTQTGELIGLKVPSTPPAFSEAVGVGLEQLADEHGVDLREIGTIAHGTTIAVNTLIQRTGARLGLLVTDGFRDVLELQRLRLPNPFDLDGSPRPWTPPSTSGPRAASTSAGGRQDFKTCSSNC